MSAGTNHEPHRTLITMEGREVPMMVWKVEPGMVLTLKRCHRWRMKQQRVRDRRALGSAAGRDRT